MTLHLLSYNNYALRKIKVERNITDYDKYILSTVENVNFNPNDGIATEQIVNYLGTTIPDYCIAEDTNSISRWFVMECKRTRGTQYKLTLYRDVIADNYDAVLNSTAFISRGLVDTANPLIFNNENFSFNQIPQYTEDLSEPCNCNWVVGYVPKNWPSEDTVVTAHLAGDIAADYETNSIPTWCRETFGSGYDTVNSNCEVTPYPAVKTYVDVYSSFFYSQTGSVTRVNRKTPVNIYSGQADLTNLSEETVNSTDDLISPRCNTAGTATQQAKWLINSSWTNLESIRLNISNTLGTSRLTDYGVNQFNNKTIKDTASNITYRLSVTFPSSFDTVRAVTNTASDLFDLLNSQLSEHMDSSKFYSNSGDSRTFIIRYTENKAVVTFTPVVSTASVTFSSNRYHCSDSNFDMFCIPCDGPTIIGAAGSSLGKGNTNIALAIGSALSEQTGLSNSQFDVQLLPYCPARYLQQSDNVIQAGTSQYFPISVDSTSVATSMFWCLQSQFTLQVGHTYYPIATNPIDVKVEYETTFMRLCSPNYSGVFEFNPLSGDGFSYFTVSCYYQPYAPYIHLMPNLKNLYGSISSDQDFRGLTLGGDFSLPQASNSWATYQLNNKNYQEIFNRETQSLELKNKVGLISDITNVITGAASAASSGAVIGSIVPGLGNVAGAVIGGAASAIGGIADVGINQMLRQDSMDLRNFNFTAQLQNIQAIPNSISKTTALTPLNHRYPFIEVYSATTQEQELLTNYFLKRSFTINAIDVIKNYVKPSVYNDFTFIEAQLIDISIEGDYSLVAKIRDELAKGVYLSI